MWDRTTDVLYPTQAQKKSLLIINNIYDVL